MSGFWFVGDDGFEPPTLCLKRIKLVNVKNIRSVAEYNRFAEYLVFVNGTFQLNNKVINEYCDTFNIYAETPEQIALYNHWQSVCDLLNIHNKKYPLGGTNMDQICKALKLQQVNDKFLVNQIALSEQIKYIR